MASEEQNTANDGKLNEKEITNARDAYNTIVQSIGMSVGWPTKRSPDRNLGTDAKVLLQQYLQDSKGGDPLNSPSEVYKRPLSDDQAVKDALSTLNSEEHKAKNDGKLSENEISEARNAYSKIMENFGLSTRNPSPKIDIGPDSMVLLQQYMSDRRNGNLANTTDEVNKRPLSDLDPAVKEALATLEGLNKALKDVPNPSELKAPPSTSAPKPAAEATKQ